MASALSPQLAEPTTAELIALLDPSREYGERGYAGILEGVEDGSVLIEPGHSLPVLRDRATNRSIKGTGAPVGADLGGLQQTALAKFRDLAINDVPEYYECVMQGVREGDPRWAKIYGDITFGKIGEFRGAGLMTAAFMALLEKIHAEPEERLTTFEQPGG